MKLLKKKWMSALAFLHLTSSLPIHAENNLPAIPDQKEPLETPVPKSKRVVKENVFEAFQELLNNPEHVEKFFQLKAVADPVDKPQNKTEFTIEFMKFIRTDFTQYAALQKDNDKRFNLTAFAKNMEVASPENLKFIMELFLCLRECEKPGREAFTECLSSALNSHERTCTQIYRDRQAELEKQSNSTPSSFITALYSKEFEFIDLSESISFTPHSSPQVETQLLKQGVYGITSKTNIFLTHASAREYILSQCTKFPEDYKLAQEAGNTFIKATAYLLADQGLANIIETNIRAQKDEIDAKRKPGDTSTVKSILPLKKLTFKALEEAVESVNKKKPPVPLERPTPEKPILDARLGIPLPSPSKRYHRSAPELTI